MSINSPITPILFYLITFFRQHIAHVQNLQQFAPAFPVQPVYRPNVHNHGQPIYFKQNDPVEKAALNLTETETKTTAQNKTTDNKIEEPKTTERNESAEKSEKTEITKLPSPMNEVLAVNGTGKN